MGPAETLPTPLALPVSHLEPLAVPGGLDVFAACPASCPSCCWAATGSKRVISVHFLHLCHFLPVALLSCSWLSWDIWEHPEDPQLTLSGPLQQLLSEAAAAAAAATAAKEGRVADMQEEHQTSLHSRGWKSVHVYVELVIVLESGKGRRWCFPQLSR